MRPMAVTIQCRVMLCAVLGFVALTGRAEGQVTYSIFPAIPHQLANVETQPTGRDAKVTLTVQDSSLRYVVRELAHQAHLRVVFTGGPLYAERISVRLVDVAVMDAFAKVLQGKGVIAKLAPDEETVVISAMAGVAPGRVRTDAIGGEVDGRVTDSASGAGLGGVSVKVMGTKLATVTSDSGHFTFKDVPPGEQVLTVRLFGYRPAERTVTVVDSGQTTVHITMVAVPTVLSGVVTTATGVQRKVEVGNDITTLNVDSIMKIAPISSVTDLLETRVPGLTVLHSSGVPGDPSRIRIRGVGSIVGSNDPIIVIDGIRVYASQSDPRNNNLAPNNTTGQIATIAAPSPLDQLDPNSIETIEVLKGPSASALYGSDAANGVVVITTKHGRAGPTSWSLAFGQGVNWLPGAWPTNYFFLGYNDELLGPLCNWANRSRSCQVDSIRAFQALNDPRYSVFSHGSDQTVSLTISGGVPTLQYSLTGTGAGDIGNLKLPAIEQQRYEADYGPIPGWIVRPDNYQQWGVTGQLTAQPSANLRVTLQSSLFNGDQQQGSLQQAISQLEGSYISPTLLGNTPLIQNDVQKATDASLTSTNALTISWQPRWWLPLTATAGVNTIERTDQTYVPFGVSDAGIGQNDIATSTDTTGFFGLGRGTSEDVTLTVGTAIPLPHIVLGLGGNLFDESTADFDLGTNKLAPGVSVPTSFLSCGTLIGAGSNNQCTPSPTTQSTTAASTYGWYVEPRLNFASRFFAAPGFRLDGGSGGTHATTSAGGLNGLGGLSAFPKIDFSYVAVDRQNQRPLWGMLTLLRPRVAFGYAGTQPGPAEQLRMFNYANQGGGGFNPNPGGEGNLSQYGQQCGGISINPTTAVPAVCLNALGNTQLRPETSSELEGGVDATLWRGRLSLTYTQYNKTRHNAILEIPVAPSVVIVNGANSDNFSQTQIAENIGVVRNTGTELTANAIVLQTREVSWTLGMNLSNDNNLLVRLNPGQVPFCVGGGNLQYGGQSCLVPGYPLDGEWMRPIAGFADANHDGILEPNEIVLKDSAVYVGQPNPKYQLNFTTDVALLHGRLSVHATFAYQNGLTQNNNGSLTSGAYALLGNAPTATLAEQAAIVAAQCGQFYRTCGTNEYTDIGITQTVNTFRFQDLSIVYEVPTRMSTWVRIPRMTVGLQGSNLGLHTNYRGIDPDVNAFSTVSAGDETADLGQIPEPRTWWLKFTVGN